MNQRIISEIGRSHRIAIVNLLKRSQGMTVREMAVRLKKSYMGVKQHCITLAADGYLDTWRRPKPRGRPEMLYRLTQRAHELFPETSNAMTIELLKSASVLYGAAAAEKLLFHLFQRKAADYRERMRGGSLAERVKWLARLRDAEGCMADCLADPLRIVEHHSPIMDLLRVFPIAVRLETESIQRALDAPIRREEETVSGLYRCTFFIGES